MAEIRPGTYRCRRDHGEVTITKGMKPEKIEKIKKQAAAIQIACIDNDFYGMCCCPIADLLKNSLEDMTPKTTG